MSETDDTDELLILPPDLFLTHHPNHDDSLPYFDVVDSLITQVNNLEDRVNHIQSSTDVSIVSTRADDMYQPLSKFRKFCSSEDLLQPQRGFNSTQSTPQKPRSKFTANSLPSSPGVEGLSPRNVHKRWDKESPDRRKKDINPMLGEIDNFLSNVKLIKRLGTSRNLESDFREAGDQNLNSNEIDKMLKDMELRQRSLDDRLREKEREFLGAQERPCVKDRLWQAGDNACSVPDYSYGMKKSMYPETKQSVETMTKSTANYVEQSPTFVPNEKFESETSSESTKITAYEKYNLKDPNFKDDVHTDAINILNLHKQLLDNTDLDFNLGLMSLSSLWNSKGSVQDIPSQFQQKLQEERLRRQHCEQAIKELQNKILELQERIAVAIQVDEVKTKTIGKFQNCWDKVGQKIKDLETSKDKLESEMDKLKEKNRDDCEEHAQKTRHYEEEISKALNLAHGNQDKLLSLEKLYSDLQEEYRQLENKYEDLQRRHANEADKNRQYPEIIAQKELELNENKNVLAEARKEVSQSRKAVETCQSDLQSLRSENTHLQSKLREEKDKNSRLAEHKNKLVEEINAHKNVEKGFQEELNKTREQLENNKMELKNYYQGQVEIVVQNKLKEFQNQLDAAEKALKEDFTRKELSMAKMAASHIHQISEKHILEVKLLEEKHQEECRLYQVQLSQLHQELDDTNSKLKRQQEKQANIERHLHKFMESLRQDQTTTLDEMNSFRSKSFTNLEEILSWRAPQGDGNNKNGGESDRNAQGTYRVAMETPVTSKEDKGTRRREISLQETIQMLLDKNKQTNEVKDNEGGQQSSLYQRLLKEAKGKPPWK